MGQIKRLKMKRVSLGDSVGSKFENETEAADASIGLRIKGSVYNYVYEKVVGYIVEPVESIRDSAGGAIRANAKARWTL